MHNYFHAFVNETNTCFKWMNLFVSIIKKFWGKVPETL